MYIANVETNNDWQDLAALVSAKNGETFSFSSGNTYYITNNSDSAVYLVNVTTKPETKNGIGMRLPGNAQAAFVPGDSEKVWVISFTGACNLQVEQQG